MNTSDGNYIGYLLATIHTLDIFSTSKSATIKNAHQARIQAITATVCESWLKTLKEWGAKKVETGLNQPLIYIRPIRETKPTKCTNFFLTYLHHNITLNIVTRFDPQGNIIRESNQSNAAKTKQTTFVQS